MKIERAAATSTKVKVNPNSTHVWQAGQTVGRLGVFFFGTDMPMVMADGIYEDDLLL